MAHSVNFFCLTLPHPQHIQAIMQAFNDNNVSFVVRGLQVLVMLADPNGGTFHSCSFTLVLGVQRNFYFTVGLSPELRFFHDTD